MSLDSADAKSGTLPPLPVFCHACFSIDRTLWPVKNLLVDFYNLIQHPGPRHTVCLCWECMGLLRRVSNFKRNVTTVQAFLHQYKFSQNTTLPPPLTRLSTTHVRHDDVIPASEGGAKTDGDTERIDGMKSEPSAPLLLGHDLKEETADDVIEATSPDWQSEGCEKTLTQTECPTNKAPKKSTAKKYVIIAENDLSLRQFYTEVPIDAAMMESLLEQDRSDEEFLKYPHRCDKCVRGWKDGEKQMLHTKKYHSKISGPFKCDVCASRVHSKASLSRHVRAHSLALRCMRCPLLCGARASMRRHVLQRHARQVRCLGCGACFHNVREFFEHYRSLHRHFVCDHCGKRYVSRVSIKKHLANHGPFVCNQCDGQVFKTRDSLGAHRRLKHSELARPELAYCVECDRQFDSVRAYRMHLADNDAHRKNARKRHFPCPACGKVYVRNSYMRAHHKLVHLQRSDFSCGACDASFVNRAQYVLHMKMKHEGYTRPKNKLCPVCGRGFTRNWYLRNHLRTHTGERPFTCAHCDASFGQRAAMKAHERHIHLKGK